jgi:hypothetical protein
MGELIAALELFVRYLLRIAIDMQPRDGLAEGTQRYVQIP